MMRLKMKPIAVVVHGQEVTIMCRHAGQWPPAHARLDESFEKLRATGDIDDREYQRLKVWEGVCGLMAMEADKCGGCPHAMAPLMQGPAVPLRDLQDSPARLKAVRRKLGMPVE